MTNIIKFDIQKKEKKIEMPPIIKTESNKNLKIQSNLQPIRQ